MKEIGGQYQAIARLGAAAGSRPKRLEDIWREGKYFSSRDSIIDREAMAMIGAHQISVGSEEKRNRRESRAPPENARSTAAAALKREKQLIAEPLARKAMK